ncbi:MAG: hypothetical protein IK088_03095, partial [Lachnospiraceae bacterium]|nr:hypothetical protein [Lachnospiraceae bacterium]
MRAFIDLLVILIAYVITFVLFFHVFPADSFFGGVESAIVTKRDYVTAALYIAPLNILLFWVVKLYRPMRFTGRRSEAFRVFEANVLTILIIIVIFWLFVKEYSTHFSRVFLAEFGVLNTFFIVLEKSLIRAIFVKATKKGFNAKKILVVGCSDSCRQFLKRVSENARWGYQVCGILDDQMEKGEKYLGYEVIGPLSDLPSILEENVVEEVFVSLRLNEYDKLE